MLVQLQHPTTGRIIEVDSTRVAQYLSQGWLYVGQAPPTPDLLDLGVEALLGNPASETAKTLLATFVPHQDDPPTDPDTTPVYVDTSTEPPVVLGWDGDSWEPIGGGGGGTVPDASTTVKGIVELATNAETTTGTDTTRAVTPAGLKVVADTKYAKPVGGIPSTDLTAPVQTTLAQVGSPYVGKKLVVCGTSISFLDRYVTPTIKPLSIGTVINLGISGATLSTAGGAGGAISGQFTTGNIPADTDMLWAEVGINDFLQSVPLGTIADTSKATSFYGALVETCNWIVANRPRAQVYFIIPFGSAQTGGLPGYLTPNANGATMEQFQQAIKDVCQRFSFPFIDVAREASVGGAYNGPTLHTADHLHPNRYGGWRMGLYIASTILRTPFFVPRTSSASLALITDATLTPNPAKWGVSPFGDIFAAANEVAPTSWERFMFAPGVRSVEYTGGRGTVTNTDIFAITAANATHSVGVSEAPTTAKFGRFIVGGTFDNYNSITQTNAPVRRRVKVAKVGGQVVISSAADKGAAFSQHYSVPNAQTDAVAPVKAITDLGAQLGFLVDSTGGTAYPSPHLFDVSINDVPILEVLAAGVLPA